MSEKSANICVQIEPDIKETAEKILDALGISPSNAINMFYKQIILQNGLPFEEQLPQNFIMSATPEELRAQIMAGYIDFLNGNVKPAKDVFANIRKKTDV